MANNIGTLVIAQIRPQAEGDPIATALANDIQGGWHQVTSISDRDAIISARKVNGMACFVTDVSASYIWGDSGWTLNSGGVTSIEGLTGVVDISGGSGISITTAGNSVVITNNIEYVSVPASPTATGTQGQRAYGSNYVYECIATNTWVRYAAASSW
jgi:hypothetical protein